VTNKIILLVGVPGSGKSTWAKKYVEDSENHTIRVNNDELREMMNTVLYDWRNESLIADVVRDTVVNGLLRGWNVIIDNMNISKKHYNYWKKFADSQGYEVEVRIFDPGLDICIERDKLRSRTIGEERIKEIYAQFERNWK